MKKLKEKMLVSLISKLSVKEQYAFIVATIKSISRIHAIPSNEILDAIRATICLMDNMETKGEDNAR